MILQYHFEVSGVKHLLDDFIFVSPAGKSACLQHNQHLPSACVYVRACVRARVRERVCVRISVCVCVCMHACVRGFSIAFGRGRIILMMTAGRFTRDTLHKEAVL